MCGCWAGGFLGEERRERRRRARRKWEGQSKKLTNGVGAIEKPPVINRENVTVTNLPHVPAVLTLAAPNVSATTSAANAANTPAAANAVAHDAAVAYKNAPNVSARTH